MTLEKAKLIPKLPSSGVDTIEFMFNPKSLSFKRGITLKEADGSYTSKGLPKYNFEKLNAATLTINEIWFDTYEDGTSVLFYINKLIQAVEFAGTTKVAPVYVFTWGTQNYIQGFVTSLDYELTLFLPDGTPVRAKVSLTIQQSDETTPHPSQKTPTAPNRQQGGRS